MLEVWEGFRSVDVRYVISEKGAPGINDSSAGRLLHLLIFFNIFFLVGNLHQVVSPNCRENPDR